MMRTMRIERLACSMIVESEAAQWSTVGPGP